MNKKNSLYIQVLRLLLVAVCCSGIVFIILNISSNYFIEKYYYNNNWKNKRDIVYVDKLQKYVNANKLTTRDTDELEKWVKKQKVLSLRVYKDERMMFDSDYSDVNIWEKHIDAHEYEWEIYYAVVFQDGSAKVSLIGWYEYQLYNCILVLEIIFSFVLFVIIFLLGIRKKIQYLLKLSEEVKILEGGCLNYEITKKGEDELAVLAEGLDNMRIAFQNMLDREAEIVSENNRIITEMSHDLRTPVTAILLYIEILEKGRYHNEEQVLDYLDKINRKVHRLKQLADNLLAYSLVSGEINIELDPAEYFEALFYDLFSETCNYLIQNGFSVVCNINWRDVKLRVYTEYIVRIIENISSNIIKYADNEEKVIIAVLYWQEKVEVIFENKIKENEENTESTSVGVQSIKNMMKKMNGSVHIVRENKKYKISLFFTYAEK